MEKGNRLNAGARAQLISQNAVPQINATEKSLTIEEDSNVYLFAKNKITEYPFRIIKGRINKTSEPIWFVTNIPDMDPYEVAAIYKKRWDIELFF